MKHNVNLIMRYLFYGISWGCMFFVFTCLAGFWISGEAFLAPITKDFTRQVIGTIIVGIGCGSTAIVYQFERIPWWAKVLIHFIVGMGTFFPTSLYLGWIPFYPEDVLYTVIQFFISFSIFTAIWLCFYFFNRMEAKKINDRLRELEKSDSAV